MRFFRQVLGTLSTELAITGLNFLAGILLARLLPPAERGVLALMLLLPVTLSYFADIGVSQSIVFQIGRRKRSLDAVVGNALTMALVLGSAAALLVWLLHTRLLPGGLAFLRQVPPGALPVLLGLLPFLMVDAYLLSVLRGRQLFGLFNLRRLLPPILLVPGILILVGWKGWGLQGGLVAFVISSLAPLALLAAIVRRLVPLRLRLDREISAEALRFGLKSYLQNLVGHLHYRLDVYLIALFLPPEQVAYYIVATSVAEVAFYLPDAVGLVLYPRLVGEKNEDMPVLTAEAARHTLAVTGLACLGLSAAGWLLIPRFYGPAYRAAVLPFMILLPGIMAMAVYKVLSRYFTSRDRQQVTVLAAGMALGLNAALNLYLARRLGLAGAAGASLISYSALAVVLLWAFRRETGIPFASVLFLRRSDLARYRLAWDQARRGALAGLRLPSQAGERDITKI